MATATRPRRPDLRAFTERVRGLESLAAFAACLVASVVIAGRLLRPDVVSDDALVHQYWMWQFRDPQLFTDPLTAELRDSARYPPGYVGLFWIATHVADPIAFGEWLGVFLMAASGWLVWRIVREHTAWWPAAWIAGALFLSLIDIQRFYGGFPRAFVHPVVLLTVLLALRGRQLPAALVAAAGALLYPPSALLAVGVLIVTAVFRRDLRRLAYAGGALAATAAAVLVPRVLAGGSPRVLSGAEARGFPEFGPHGPLHFFSDSTLEYLAQNRSGFDLRTSGSILAVAALALLLARRGNWRLLRPEVLAMPVVALGGWAVAQLVLFQLYLPHRYTYPLIAFFAIVVGITLEPTWRALSGDRRRAFALLAAPIAAAGAAVYLFPLGPLDTPGWRTLVIAAAVAAIAAGLAWIPAVRRPAIGAAVTGAVLVGAILVIPDARPRGSKCPQSAATRALHKLPKDSVIAGDPSDLKCLAATARRPVVISTQLSPSYEAEYFHHGRERMFAMLRAYYGHSPGAFAELEERYGATHLLVRRNRIRREMAGGGVRWRQQQQPYGAYVRRLLRGGTPSVLDLPARCRTWTRGSVEIYDLRCVTRRGAGSSLASSES